MNVICPKCKETYSIKIDLFLNKEQQLQCISCGHNWKENFSKEATENEKNFQNLLSIKADRKLTSKQVLKILNEESEFDKKFKKVPLNKKNDEQRQKSYELQGQELSSLGLLRIKQFWFGFSISVIIVAILCIIYIYKDILITQFPYLKNYVGPFVDFIDSIRYWLDGHKKEFINFIRNRFLKA